MEWNKTIQARVYQVIRVELTKRGQLKKDIADSILSLSFFMFSQTENKDKVNPVTLARYSVKRHFARTSIGKNRDRFVVGRGANGGDALDNETVAIVEESSWFDSRAVDPALIVEDRDFFGYWLDNLTEPQQRAVIMRGYGHSNGYTAHTLGVTPGRASQLISEAHAIRAELLAQV